MQWLLPRQLSIVASVMHPEVTRPHISCTKEKYVCRIVSFFLSLYKHLIMEVTFTVRTLAPDHFQTLHCRRKPKLHQDFHNELILFTKHRRASVHQGKHTSEQQAMSDGPACIY